MATTHSKLIVLVFGAVLALARPASAAPLCTTTTVASLVGSSCQLGDKEFTFTTYVPGGFDWTLGGPLLLDPALILFAPDASDPFALRFTLSSPGFRAASTVGEDGRYSFGELYFTILSPPESLFVAEVAAAVMAPTVMTGAPTPGHSALAYVAADLVLETCGAVALVGMNGEGPVQMARPCANVPAPVQSGYAFWTTSAGGGAAEASMAAATYVFHQTTEIPVPEPSVLVLFALAVLPVVVLRPKPDRRAGPRPLLP
ncbi:MAG TPA: hypothetical protein VK467_04545 [Gemmatimonadales bacterium]|nr:hypothetical protein [Gemmatimonadales bacterium]